MSEAEALREIIDQARRWAGELRRSETNDLVLSMTDIAWITKQEVADKFERLAGLAQRALDDNPEFDWAALQGLRRVSAR